MRNLEQIEQKCLAYLAQVSNPLASMDNLVRHLRADENCPPFEERELLDFLRHHELFRVLEASPPSEDAKATRLLEELGVSAGPRVILATRTPTGEQLAEMIRTQLGQITAALEATLQEARRTGGNDAENRVLDALARAEKLGKSVQSALDAK